jgi:hypothetical protein
VSYTFLINVKCTVTSMTLTSLQADFNYELNQGAYTTLVYTASQISACNHAYTYSVAHY